MSFFGTISFIFLVLMIITMMSVREKQIMGMYYHEIFTFLWLIFDIIDSLILGKGFISSAVLLVLSTICIFMQRTK